MQTEPHSQFFTAKDELKTLSRRSMQRLNSYIFFSTDTCLNGGECVEVDEGLLCLCKPGFKGEVCEIEVDECESSPCLNGALCIDYLNSYECACSPGFSGMNCEVNDQDCTERYDEELYEFKRIY